MTKKLKILSIFLIFKLCAAQKCSIISQKHNTTQSVLCQNVNSMNDIVSEIKNTPAWMNVKIVNKAPVVEFTNTAANVPYLNLVQSLDLSCAGKLNLNENGFSSYDSLKNLDISGMEVKTLKSSWFSKKSVEVLDVSRNKLTELKKDNLKFLPKLKSFNGSYNEIGVLEANAFLESKKIEQILLNNNHITAVHFENLDSLRFLNLRGNALSAVIGANYVRMPKLEVLILSENQIPGGADRWFETLESLRHLNLSSNKIPYIGDWSCGGGEKTKLAEMDLSYNSITVLYPICFTHLPLLTFLDVSHNRIVELYVQNFSKQALLQALYLNDNRIEKIAANSFEALLQLRIFDISGNKLKTFSAQLFGTKFGSNRLRKLNLSNNLLTGLDATLLSVLKNLVTLNVSFNQLKELPASTLGNNTNLAELYLDSNEIEFLESTFFKNLKAMEEFSVQNNRISFIPDTTHLKKLTKLSIGNNPMQCICMKEILIWCRTNKCKFINAKPSSKNPDCVIIPETLCIKDKTKLDSYGIYDRFLDAMPLEGSDRSIF